MSKRQIAPARWLWVLALLVSSATAALAQQTITGVITDSESGETLIGANVLVPGTSIGTATDFDGNFELTVPADASSLQISYAGYQTQTISLESGETFLDLQMSAGELLDEVVVVGYGTQSTKEVTSAVTTIKERDFNQGVVNNPTQLVQGKVAGLQIANPGGNPNSTPTIRLRGLSTLGANTEPLIIIDGVIGASLNTVDPSDIASIDVLKDGSAAAIYGTRGSSGVIIVTTKTGVKGETSVTYNVQGGVEQLARGVQVADAERFIELRGRDADGNLIDSDGDGVADVDFGARNDYYDQLTRTALSQVHNLSLSGGLGTGSYRASVNFRDVQGVANNTGFDQVNARVNVTQRALDDMLKFDLTASTTTRNSDFGFDEAFRYAAIYNPTLPVRVDEPDGPSENGYIVQGGYTQIDQFDYFNPIALIEQNSNTGKVRDALFSGKVTFSPVDRLDFSAQYSLTTQDAQFDIFESRFSRGRGADRRGFAERTLDVKRNNLLELVGNYGLDFGQGNEIKFLAGYSYQEFIDDNSFFSGGDLITDVSQGNNFGFSQDIANGLADISTGGDRQEIESYFGRVSLDIANTYYLTASLRSDGSTRFGQNEKRGIFPAVSAGVDLGGFVNNDNVNTLKLRVGYGITGNIPGESLLSQGVYTLGGAYPITGNSELYLPGVRINRARNSGLRFERKGELNAGLDFAFADYKVTGTVDYFRRRTTDLLFNVTVPIGGQSPAGDIFFADNIEANLDDVVFQNEGVEFTIAYNSIGNDVFSWTPRLVFSSVRTILDSADTDDAIFQFFPGEGNSQFQFETSPGAPGQNNAPTQIIRAGEEIGQIYTYVYQGVGDDGEFEFEDLNGDGVIDITADESPDKRVVGSGLPDFTLGFQNEFRYGDFDLQLFFRGAFGHSLANMPRNFYENLSPSRGTDNVVVTELFDPNIRFEQGQFNSLYVEEADFVTLDNASLGYRFRLGNDSKLRSARVALSGQRLFYITNYTGVDPEVRYADNSDPLDPNALAPGIDRRNNYFRTRSFNLALNVTF